MDNYEEVQASYIARLRAIQPGLLLWWSGLTGSPDPNEAPPAEVANRWPTGIAGHPRVIAIFREHFLRIDELNEEYLDQREDPEADAGSEDLWGVDDQGEEVAIRSPQDLLIFDIKDQAPDLAKLVAGLVFIPVGLNQHDEAV